MDAAPSSSTKHASAIAEKGDFGWVTVPVASTRMSLLHMPQTEKHLVVKTEADVQDLVKALIDDVLEGVGLSRVVGHAREVVAGRYRYDHGIFFGTGYPCGAGDSKMVDTVAWDAGREPQLDVHIWGQVYDYVWQLRLASKVVECFCFVSTYTHTWIAWMDDEDTNALATRKSFALPKALSLRQEGETVSTRIETPERVQAARIAPSYSPVGMSQVQRDPPRGYVAADASQGKYIVPEKGVKIDEDEERVVKYDGPFLWNDPHLPHILACLFSKMSGAERKDVLEIPVAGASRYVAVMSSRGVNYKFLKFNWDGPLFFVMPVLQAGTLLYALSWLGTGRDGSVILACSASGKVCVLKFHHGEEKEKNLKEELEAWLAVYGEESGVKSAEYHGRQCLVMPFCSDVVPSDRLAVLNDVRAVLKKIAAAGYVHTDIKWRNIGTRHFRDGKSEVVVYDLVKLGLMPEGSQEGDAEWIDEAIRSLSDHASEQSGVFTCATVSSNCIDFM